PIEVARLCEEGYRTLKVKVGFDPPKDAARVAAIQRSIPANVQLRLDANQGYSPEQARDFLDRLDPAAIELFEPAFPRARWAWARGWRLWWTSRSRPPTTSAEPRTWAFGWSS